MLTARVEVPAGADARSFYDQLERNLAGVAGVESVALSTSDPASGDGWSQFAVEGKDYTGDQPQPGAGVDVISSGYFQTLNLPVLQGRFFNAGDQSGSLPVAIVNSSFAKMCLPPGQPYWKPLSGRDQCMVDRRRLRARPRMRPFDHIRRAGFLSPG